MTLLNDQLENLLKQQYYERKSWWAVEYCFSSIRSIANSIFPPEIVASSWCRDCEEHNMLGFLIFYKPGKKIHETPCPHQ